MASLIKTSTGTRVFLLAHWPVSQAAPVCLTRNASTAAGEATATQSIPDLADLESDSSLGAPEPPLGVVETFQPWKRAAQRKYRLPAGRYQYHPPKYDRGPFHPIQSPPSSEPIARDFVPGPFNLPRLKQTYQSTIASDLLTLTYLHKPPGTPKQGKSERLRGWDDSSPYHKNRARRGPRGSEVLRLIERDITFKNIPEIKAVSLAMFTPEAQKDRDYLIVARAMLMAITGTMPEITRSKHAVAAWGAQKDKYSGVKTTIYGNAAYEFLDRCIHLVFPKIKDWKGVKGTTGDSSGNLSWGLEPEHMAYFPEIEVNYDMYPSKMMPGCRVYVHTTATSDRQAKLLLRALGVPFYGELRD
ncbi:hypothetical protein VTK73DRAFT_8441 [Phialemonium thermophilum]|uniref:Ribosomal protein L5 C-terminal domain-containing protein n=1 Tax=Phialemonium thermophilum TaxID=223376 RepID=A0ABR3XQ09_9PEZI